MTKLTELIDRLEKATEADRELDREVVMIFSPQLRGLPMDERGRWVHPLDGPIYAENLTGSLDEAIALVKRVLPGVWWEVSSSKIATLDIAGDTYEVTTGATPAIALLIALLRTTPERGEG